MRMTCVRIVTVGIVLLLYASPVIATLTLADGGVHNIDYAVSTRIVVDSGWPALRTTVNILEGADLRELWGFGDSIINVSGGSIDSLKAYDNSQALVSSGSMKSLAAHDSSQITVSGGSIYTYVSIGRSQTTVSGGSISRLVAGGNSRVTVSGGSIVVSMRLSSSAIITIDGSDFAVDGTPIDYIELTSILGGDPFYERYRRLTGTLLNGDPLDNDFRIGDSAKIVLIPEPATLLLLGLGGMMLRKRRQA